MHVVHEFGNFHVRVSGWVPLRQELIRLLRRDGSEFVICDSTISSSMERRLMNESASEQERSLHETWLQSLIA